MQSCPPEAKLKPGPSSSLWPPYLFPFSGPQTQIWLSPGSAPPAQAPRHWSCLCSWGAGQGVWGYHPSSGAASWVCLAQPAGRCPGPGVLTCRLVPGIHHMRAWGRGPRPPLSCVSWGPWGLILQPQPRLPPAPSEGGTSLLGSVSGSSGPSLLGGHAEPGARRNRSEAASMRNGTHTLWTAETVGG